MSETKDHFLDELDEFVRSFHANVSLDHEIIVIKVINFYERKRCPFSMESLKIHTRTMIVRYGKNRDEYKDRLAKHLAESI
jgi:hypothetical protein